MTAKADSRPDWGNQYRLVASEKWRAKSAAMGQPVTDALVEYAQPAPGMQVLDLASGTGEPAISLASRVGEQGHVTATDISVGLLEIAAKRGKKRGLKNFTTQVADAHKLPFTDNSFDLATSRFGVMFFDDPIGALQELRRVMRPGARACFLAWGQVEQPYWQSTMGVVHKHVGGPLLRPDGPDPFKFPSRAACRKFFGARDSTRSRKKPKRCHGHGLAKSRSCGSTRNRSQFHFVRCWSACLRRSGRRFTLKFTLHCAGIRTGRKSR